jgi:hypothetical protein
MKIVISRRMNAANQRCGLISGILLRRKIGNCSSYDAVSREKGWTAQNILSKMQIMKFYRNNLALR